MVDHSTATIDTTLVQGDSDGAFLASFDPLLDQQQQHSTQNQNQNQQRSPLASHKMNFADALTKNLLVKRTRDQIRADFKQLEVDTTKEDWNNVDSTSNVVFTHIPDEFVIGIPYDKTTIPVTDVANTIHSTFSYPSAIGINFRTRGIVFVILATDADRQAALAMQTIPFEPHPLPILPTILSLGRRVTIQVDYIPVYNITERRELLQELFQPFGRIIHITSHHHPTSKINFDGTSFILEVHKEAPNDIQLPRVAQVKGSNILFAWTGSPFCFRCGSGDHIKLQCPLPLNYDITTDQHLDTPVMARAFPDPKAPLREMPKPKSTRNASSLAKTSAQNSLQEDGFQLQGSGKKRNRKARISSSRVETDHASESDSALQPATKKGPRPLSQESNIVDATALIRRKNSHSVADGNSSLSAPNSLGPQHAGATPSPVETGEVVTPPSNLPVDATDNSDGSAGVTTPPPGGPPREEMPGALQEEPEDHEDKTTNAQQDESMDGVEYTTIEQMELDNPETSIERRAEIKAECKKRMHAARQRIRKAAAASTKATANSKDPLTGLRSGINNTSRKG